MIRTKRDQNAATWLNASAEKTDLNSAQRIDLNFVS